MVNNLKDESVISVSTGTKTKDDLIKSLVSNGFKYDNEVGYYYLNENEVKYFYFPARNLIKVHVSNDNDVEAFSIYIDNLNLEYTYFVNNERVKFIEVYDCTNKDGKNYNLFFRLYNQYLSKYFKDFLEV